MKSSDEPTPETARAAMVAALISVRSHLPPAVQAGVLVAARTTDVRENEVARVALWEVINGREQSDTPEVLHTRLAIAVLHPGDIASDTQTSLEYFVDWFRKSGLPESALAEVAALESYYHEA